MTRQPANPTAGPTWFFTAPVVTALKKAKLALSAMDTVRMQDMSYPAEVTVPPDAAAGMWRPPLKTR